VLQRFYIELTDVDRNVYETVDFRVARHPSETDVYLVARVVAYMFLYHPDLKFGAGLSTPDEPALSRSSGDGRLLDYIDIGTPTEERLQRSWRLAERVYVFPHRGWGNFEATLESVRGRNVEVVYFEPQFFEALAQKVERQNRWSVTVSGGSMFVDIGEEHFSAEATLRRMD
jgi:uncharacterized protein YaeQ